MLPVGSRVSGEFFIMKQLYNTFLVKIKALRHCESVAAGPRATNSLTMVNIYSYRVGLIAGARLARKEFLKFTGAASAVLGAGWRGFLGGDIRPQFGVFGVDAQPLLHALLGIGLDRLNR